MIVHVSVHAIQRPGRDAFKAQRVDSCEHPGLPPLLLPWLRFSSTL